jgi:hypothetical protein
MLDNEEQRHKHDEHDQIGDEGSEKTDVVGVLRSLNANTVVCVLRDCAVDIGRIHLMQKHVRQADSAKRPLSPLTHGQTFEKKKKKKKKKIEPRKTNKREASKIKKKR